MGCHLSQNANFETFTKYRRYLLNIDDIYDDVSHLISIVVCVKAHVMCFD